MSSAISDLLHSLHTLGGNLLSKSGQNEIDNDSVEHAFINSTLIALGELNKTNVEDLMETIKNAPAVMWNISPQTPSDFCKECFTWQVLDCSWNNAQLHTKAPSLASIFSLCLTMKSWQELSSKNLAVVHSPTKSSAAGILIACYLKYIGAYEHTSLAYDYYCSKKLMQESTQISISPTYKTLFDNVDKAVNHNGYLNTQPLHLKSLTLSGLPVDELPSVEIHDLNGSVFASHHGFRHTPACTWDSEEGNGFFRISRPILGDFTIVCRFGGHLASQKDKSTLIFKYQNSTAFLPIDVIQLSYLNVDINEQYLDSIDSELFRVQIMFSDEVCSDVVADSMKTANSHTSLVSSSSVANNTSQKLTELPVFYKSGIEAFQNGLEELSRMHPIPADPPMIDALETLFLRKHPPPAFPLHLTVALQLTNNNLSDSVKVLELITRRTRILLSGQSDAGSDCTSMRSSAAMSVTVGDSVRNSRSELSPTTLASSSYDVVTSSSYAYGSRDSNCNGGHGQGGLSGGMGSKRPNEFVKGGGGGPTKSSKSNKSKKGDSAGAENCPAYLLKMGGKQREDSPAFSESGSDDSLSGSIDSSWEVIEEDTSTTAPTPTFCPVCKDESEIKSDQLIPCSLCALSYHTWCVQLRKIPFTSATEEDRNKREKYVNTHYADWKCPHCADLSKEMGEHLSVSHIAKNTTQDSNDLNMSAHAKSMKTVRSLNSMSESTSPVGEWHDIHTHHSVQHQQQGGGFGFIVGDKIGIASTTPRTSGGVIVTDKVRSQSIPGAIHSGIAESSFLASTISSRNKQICNSSLSLASDPTVSKQSHRGPSGLSPEAVFHVQQHEGAAAEVLSVSANLKNKGSPTPSNASSISGGSIFGGGGSGTGHGAGTGGDGSGGNKHHSNREQKDTIAMLLTSLTQHKLSVEQLLKMDEAQQRETIIRIMSDKLDSEQSLVRLNSLQDKRGKLDLATAMRGIISNNTTPALSPTGDGSGSTGSGASGGADGSGKHASARSFGSNFSVPISAEPLVPNLPFGPGSGTGSGTGTGTGTGSGSGNGNGIGDGNASGSGNTGEGIGNGLGGVGGIGGTRLATTTHTHAESVIPPVRFDVYPGGKGTLGGSGGTGTGTGSSTSGSGGSGTGGTGVGTSGGTGGGAGLGSGSGSGKEPFDAKKHMLELIKKKNQASLADAAGSSGSAGGSGGQGGPGTTGVGTGVGAGVGGFGPGMGGTAGGYGPSGSGGVKFMAQSPGSALIEHLAKKSGLSPGHSLYNIRKIIDDSGGVTAANTQHNIGGSGSSGSSGRGSGGGSGSQYVGGHSPAIEKGQQMGVAVKEVPEFMKYFKMMKVGIHLNQVAEKLFADGLVDSEALAKALLNLNPDEPVPEQFLKKPLELDIVPEVVVESPPLTPPPASTEPEMVPISEHPKYAKFFKMLKVGLPKEAIKVKMTQEGVNPDMIDSDPKMMIPLVEPPPVEENVVKKIAVSEHPKYAKYFKMLKVGLPKEAIKAKMTQEGVDPSYIDKDPTELIPEVDEEKPPAAAPPVEMVAVAEHPKYAKFFKMMKVGLPKEAIKAKMLQEGVNADMLDKDPTELIPLDETKAPVDEPEEMVPVGEHPLYAKYFKMKKVGLPADAIKAKMTQEGGVDPSYIDKDPTEMVPLKPKADKDKTEAKKEVSKVRKKKIYWKALDKVNPNSLWSTGADEASDILLDEEEFNALFVDNGETAAKEKVVAPKEVKKQKVQLINMKRAQNGGIALARIKFKYEDMRVKIMNMDDEGLTTDQLKSLEEFLPTAEESGLIKAYKGDIALLGQAERYMLVMLGFDDAPSRIRCMIYKQQFKGRVVECRAKLSKIENACDDVKLSARLKKVLKTILKVGNQLNDGEDHKGFTLDSLLKLQSAKAFDKKTSILQYVIMLIFRNDEDCLRFNEDLKHVSEASRMTFDSVAAEKTALKDEFDTNFKIVMDIGENDPDCNTGSMIDFLQKADEQCTDLQRRLDNVKNKFAGVLNYFGEEPTMTSIDFFSTLDKFVTEFIATRDNVDRLRKAEQRKQRTEDNTAKTAAAKNNASHAAQENKDAVGESSGGTAVKRMSRRHSTLGQTSTKPTTPKQDAITEHSEADRQALKALRASTITTRPNRLTRTNTTLGGSLLKIANDEIMVMDTVHSIAPVTAAHAEQSEHSHSPKSPGTSGSGSGKKRTPRRNSVL